MYCRFWGLGVGFGVWGVLDDLRCLQPFGEKVFPGTYLRDHAVLDTSWTLETDPLIYINVGYRTVLFR